MHMLFIHRSVGRDLLKHGNFRQQLHAWNIQLDDYDNNTGVITHDDLTVAPSTMKIPGNNTNPADLEALFADWPETTLSRYSGVILKSCYPNSHIKDNAMLEMAQAQYTAIFNAFRMHDKTLVLLTTPPLRPACTNPQEAVLANQLAAWLVNAAGGKIHVFDFHRALAEPNGKHTGMLRRSYRRAMPWDNHPNELAHQTLAPPIATFIGSVV